MAISFLKKTAGGVLLALKVTPRAARSEWAGAAEDHLKVRLKAPPVEGKANDALIDFLSESLHVNRKNIFIRRGEKSRNKWVEIQGLTVSEFAMRSRVPKIPNL